jgi:hypothetical protein
LQFLESIENDQTEVSQLAKGQEEIVNESVQNENQESLETHNEPGGTSEQGLQEEQALAHNTSESNQIERAEREEIQHQDMFEKQRRVLEFPLSVGAGIGYAATGLWMILEGGTVRVPI